MGPIPKHATVAVTGAAGYIGGWAVKLLLDKGYRVRACVRKIDDPGRTDFLKAMDAYASGRLTLWEADLNNPGCFDAPFAGAQGVAHISHISKYNDEDYIRATARHIIESINKSDSVNRVIVTSSIAAVMQESDIYEMKRRPVIYEDRWPDELNPKRTMERGQGYSIGKVLAERLFADAADASGRWEAIACCPADNVGPILSKHQMERGPWQRHIAGMLAGRYGQTEAYRPWMIVDVRDTAEAHVRLLESTSVHNRERYIACSAVKRNVEDICADIARLLPELDHNTPAVKDDFPDRIKAREAELRGIWAGTELRNDRVRAATGMSFRATDDTLRDCAESLIAIGGVKVKQREAKQAEAV